MNHVDEYLTQLKNELTGSDPATQRDALADAEEYLRNALQAAQEKQPDLKEEDALPAIIDEFGAPGEIAAAYRQIEARVGPALVRTAQPERSRTGLEKFFGVLADPQAWGALLYMFISLLTGTIYFSWVVTGLSTSLALIILIIGVPFIGLFLLSVRGIALVEGRIVEGLLGVRMPRRPLFVDKNLGLWERFKVLLTSRHTWMSMLYMILLLPLGVIYFSLFVTLLSLALTLVAAPVVQLIVPLPLVQINAVRYFLPWWGGILMAVLGVGLFFATMHLARMIGRLHGALAKAILVS